MEKIKKACSKCKAIKDLDDFYNYHASSDGKTPQCKECMEKYRTSNKEKARLYMQSLREGERERINREKRESWRRKDPRSRMLLQSKNRANRKGIEHTITISDIIVPDKCPILQIPFIPGTKDNYEQTPSLDRIDNEKGYIPGNVQVISKKANSMKNSGTKEELILMAKWILKNLK